MSPKPVLAMVTDSIHPYFSGGKELRYAELSRQLRSSFDVHVYTMKWWDGPSTIEQDGIAFHAICPKLPLYHGRRRSIAQALGFALGCVRLLARRFDVLEADHMPYFHLFVLRLVTLVRRRRFVVTWHEVWGRAYWCTYLGRPGLLAALIEAVAMRLPDAIVAASDETARRLRTQLGRRAQVYVAPNGVDLAKITAAPVHGGAAVDLVTVGRLLPHKRVDLLVDTVARLHEQGRPVTCRIIGTGPEADRVREQIDRMGLSGQVELRTDVREHTDVFSLVKSARVFVLPSEREGFGIAALEGLACRLPVVTTSAPDNLAQNLVAGAPGGTVCAPDAVALAETLDRVLDQSRAVAPNGELDAWLRRFTWSAVAEKVAEALCAESGERSRMETQP